MTERFYDQIHSRQPARWEIEKELKASRERETRLWTCLNRPPPEEGTQAYDIYVQAIKAHKLTLLEQALGIKKAGGP